jgi:hypothetical protein
MKAGWKRYAALVALILIALFVVLVSPLVRTELMNKAEMNQLQHADHARLLAACRELMLNPTTSQNGKQNSGWANETEVFIRPPIPTNVPIAIRELNPEDIRIRMDYVMINLGRGFVPPRLDILAFWKGVRQFGTFNYIDGLWFWNGNQNTNQMQRINGTNF